MSAVVVAPFVLVVIVRGEDVVPVDGYWEEGWEGEDVGEAFDCWVVRAEWARKAARKLERKGRFVGIFFEFVGLWCRCRCWLRM